MKYNEWKNIKKERRERERERQESERHREEWERDRERQTEIHSWRELGLPV